jgi:hypothetical protein
MATAHGKKRYLQILLDPHRHELLSKLAAEKIDPHTQNEMKTTALIRYMVYEALERALPSSVYREAEAADAAVWRQSVRNRVKGRSKTKKDSEIQDS